MTNTWFVTAVGYVMTASRCVMTATANVVTALIRVMTASVLVVTASPIFPDKKPSRSLTREGFFNPIKIVVLILQAALMLRDHYLGNVQS